MGMERIYSDGFILDCANLLKVSDNETLQLIRNLLRKQQIQIGIFETERWIDHVRKLRDGNELDRLMYTQVMDWFSSSWLLKAFFHSNELPDNDDKNISSVWFDAEDQEQQIFDYLERRKLLSLLRQEIVNNHYRWLFKISELPTIKYNTLFNWNDYLAPYAHYTDKIYIWDRYFIYHWSASLTDLIGPFCNLNPDLEIEIISELNEKNIDYGKGLRNLDKLSAEFGKKIRFFKLNPHYGKQFHDRYLMTSYCLLKTEPGFNIKNQNKSFRDTSPTLIGRYAEGNHKWKAEMKLWDARKKKMCNQLI